MTPHLIEKFGVIYVEAIAIKENDIFYARTSIIRQASSNKKILDAKIEVQKNAVPVALIEALKSTKKPFGQLLIDFNIDVKIKNLQLFQILDEQTNKQQYGRKVDIVNALTHTLICRVEEVLAL